MKIEIFIRLTFLALVGLLGVIRLVNGDELEKKLFPNSRTKSFVFRAMEAATNYYWSNSAEWPPTLETLVPKYLDNIPTDGATGSDKIVTVYDGTGGWVYNKLNGDVSSNAPNTQPRKQTYKPDDFFGKWTIKKIKKVKSSTLTLKDFEKTSYLDHFNFEPNVCEFKGDKIINPKYVIRTETTAKRNSNFEPAHLDSYEYGYHPEREEISFLDVSYKGEINGEAEIIDGHELVWYQDGWLEFYERKTK